MTQEEGELGSVSGDKSKTIEKLREACLHSASQPNNSVPAELRCPLEFDGWTCVNSTPAGNVAIFPCPSFVTGFDPSRYAHRKCTENGTWFVHPDSNKTWSNYTTCVDVEDLEMREQVNRIYKFGYLISLIALTISLMIFFYFKALNCTRITIHKNLFLSLAINNLLWLIWYETVVSDSHLAVENGVMCRLLFVLVQYFMVATYFWMFCEGLYLHTLLVITFLTESKVLHMLYLIGWGVPALLVGLYTIVRISIAEENTLCWIHESKYGMIMSGPVCLSMIANTVFLVNIVRLLVHKLHSQQASASPEEQTPRSTSSNSFRRQRRSTISVNTASSTRTQKAARATLILIPLLGLQYLVTPFRPPERTAMEYVYQVTSALVASLQGLCVALLFCFFNGEVISAIRKKFKQCKLSYRRPWTSCSALTSVTKVKEAKKVLVQHRSQIT